MAYILVGFNALLNKDFVKIHDMFDFDQFKKDIDDMELVHEVIKLGSGKWKHQSIVKIVREVIVSQNLYANYNIDEKIEEFSQSSELRLIKNIIRATKGDMQGLGQF